MCAAVDVIEWGRERARAGAWRGRRDVAYLAPAPGAPVPSPGFVGRCLDTLSARGFARVVTGALAPAEQRGFLAVGFEVSHHLLLLSRDLDDLPPVSPVRGEHVRNRRARRRDRPEVLRVDHLAFRPFWRFDELGLDEALSATPAARFRVVDGRDLLAYAISGWAGRRGFIQRLAVHPGRRHDGIGSHLLTDALTWMRRRGAFSAVVNTQPDNDAALALYRATGFELQPVGLDVLACEL